MNPNIYNAEGYADPTAFEALMNIERRAKKSCSFRPMVYISAPLSGNVPAHQAAVRRYCRYAVDAGYIPIAPHLFFPQFMNQADKQERDLALFMDTILLTKCDELWVFGEMISKGMSIEIEKARRKDKPIRFFTTACEEVSK